MNPYYPTPPAQPAPPAPLTPQQRFKQQEALRDAIKTADEMISARRAEIDNAARGRRYKEVATKADELKRWATDALARSEELDRLMTEEHNRKKGVT